MAEPRGTTSLTLSQFEGEPEAKLRTWVQLVRTFHLVQRRIVSVLGAQDVTLPQFDVLANLRFGEGVTQQELAERLLVTKGNVCGLIDRLERLGWVQRRPDPQDGRANRLHLSAAGRAKIDALLPQHDVLVLEAMRQLSGTDAKALRRLLESLEKGVDDE